MAANRLKKDLTKLLTPQFAITIIFLFALYLVTRVINLTKIPIFADEAIYIRWAQVMRAEPTLRFLPLSDGKQPLFMWLVIPFLKLFTDPLFAGRLTSIIAGLSTLIGISALTWYFTRSRMGTITAAILYIITPYTLFFDRMALADNLLSMFGTWSLFLGLLLIKHPRLDISLLLGMILGGALITKTPALFFVFFQPVLLLTLPDYSRPRLLKIIAGWLIAGLIAFAIYNILRLGPNFHMIGARNQDYVFSFSEVIRRPLDPLIPNLNRALEWYLSLLTPLLAITTVLALFIKKHRRLTLTLLLWSLLPLIYQSAIAKVYTTRYLLYTVPPFLILSSLYFTHLYTHLKRNLFVLLSVLVLALPLLKSSNILIDPAHANIPEESRRGYFQEWTAGYGLKEIADYLTDRSHDATIVVGTEGYFGTLPDGLQIYTQNNPKITIIGIGQPVTKTPNSLLDSLSQHEVYLVVNSTRNLLSPIELTHLEPIAKYEKQPSLTGEIEYLEFYRLHPIAVR